MVHLSHVRIIMVNYNAELGGRPLHLCVRNQIYVAYKGGSICIHWQLTADYQASLENHISWMKLHGMWLIVD